MRRVARSAISGQAQRLIRTVPRKGFRFVGAIKEYSAESTKAAVPPDRGRIIPPAVVAAVSTLLVAAIGAFLLWPRAGPPWPLAIGSHSGGAPITTPGGDPHLIAGLPLTAVGDSADRLSISADPAATATELSWAQAPLAASHTTVPGHLDTPAVATTQIAPPTHETKQLAVPNTAVAKPPVPARPPNPRDPGKSFADAGRYRVEEDKFTEMPCTGTRLPGFRGVCNAAVDAVVCKARNLSIEANTLIIDPYANRFSTWCSVGGNAGYGQEDLQGMNQVTRRGSNWHDLVSNGEDKSIEFFDGQHNCVAVQKAGPRWQRGYVYMLHASICRTDTAAIRAEDVVHALDLLHIREAEPVSNLRKASD